MSEALDRLSELVRQAEAKSRAARIHIEIRTASDQLKAAVTRMRHAEQNLRAVRPARQVEIEQADIEEQQLKDLVKKMAQVKSTLEAEESPEELILAAHREIEIKRREARSEIETVTLECDDARRELRTAVDDYQQLRRDLDRLQPHLVEGLAMEDRLLDEAMLYFPTGQLQSLAREIEEGIPRYGTLDPKEQYALLKIWIGRYRRLQTFPLSEDEQTMSRRIFGKLVGLSKEYEPGYIEAFQINFTCDWDQFVEEAQEQFKQANELVRRKRELDRAHAEQRESDRHRGTRESGGLEELKSLLMRCNLPDEGADEFREVLGRAVAELGTADARLADLVRPFRDLIDGWGEFRTLQRNLDRARDDETASDNGPHESYGDLMSLTRGMRVLLVAGVARDDLRRLLQRIFEFDRLDWEAFDEDQPGAIESLEQRVRGRDVDLVLILKGPSRHKVCETLRPLSEQAGIPCLLVEHACSPAQVASTLRRGLLRVS